jgi:putative acetyltransferase
MEIRHERPEDADAIAEVHRQAFGDYGGRIAALVDDLRALGGAGGGLSLIAEQSAGVVGHVMFSPALLDAPARLVGVQVLSPVGVVPEAQRQGIATALIEGGLRILSERQVPLVFLEGDPSFYSRLGFEPACPRGFRKPSLRIPDAGFQVMILPAREASMTGTLVYPEPFWSHDAVGLRDTSQPASPPSNRERSVPGKA